MGKQPQRLPFAQHRTYINNCFLATYLVIKLDRDIYFELPELPHPEVITRQRAREIGAIHGEKYRNYLQARRIHLQAKIYAIDEIMMIISDLPTKNRIAV